MKESIFAYTKRSFDFFYPMLVIEKKNVDSTVHYFFVYLTLHKHENFFEN